MHRQGDGNPHDLHLSKMPPKNLTEKQLKRLAKAQEKKLTIDSTGVFTFLTAKQRRRRRPSRLHFRWKFSGKKMRLTLCFGGKAIAAWPDDGGDIAALVRTKMIKGERLDLRQDKTKIHRLALLLHAALEKAECGPRRKSATRQRKRLDYILRLGIYKPIVQAPVKAMWTCNCGGWPHTYALSVERCQYCQKKAPRRP